MQLRTYCATPCVTTAHDETHHILYLDWQGSLALADVQQLCPTLRQQLRGLACQKVVINNLQVTKADYGLLTWLQAELLPTFTRLGVECVAWVSGLTLQSQGSFRLMVSAFSPVRLEAFSDVEQAATWLQRIRPQQATCQVSAAGTCQQQCARCLLQPAAWLAAAA